MGRKVDPRTGHPKGSSRSGRTHGSRTRLRSGRTRRPPVSQQLLQCRKGGARQLQSVSAGGAETLPTDGTEAPKLYRAAIDIPTPWPGIAPTRSAAATLVVPAHPIAAVLQPDDTDIAAVLWPSAGDPSNPSRALHSAYRRCLEPIPSRMTLPQRAAQPGPTPALHQECPRIRGVFPCAGFALKIPHERRNYLQRFALDDIQRACVLVSMH